MTTKREQPADVSTGAHYVPTDWSRNIAPASKYPTIFAGRNHHVCVLKTEGWTAEQLESHANLISAAPALLEALCAIKAFASERSTHIHAICDSAIAAATGAAQS